MSQEKIFGEKLEAVSFDSKSANSSDFENQHYDESKEAKKKVMISTLENDNSSEESSDSESDEALVLKDFDSQRPQKTLQVTLSQTNALFNKNDANIEKEYESAEENIKENDDEKIEYNSKVFVNLNDSDEESSEESLSEEVIRKNQIKVTEEVRTGQNNNDEAFEEIKVNDEEVKETSPNPPVQDLHEENAPKVKKEEKTSEMSEESSDESSDEGIVLKDHENNFGKKTLQVTLSTANAIFRKDEAEKDYDSADEHILDSMVGERPEIVEENDKKIEVSQIKEEKIEPKKEPVQLESPKPSPIAEEKSVRKEEPAERVERPPQENFERKEEKPKKIDEGMIKNSLTEMKRAESVHKPPVRENKGNTACNKCIVV